MAGLVSKLLKGWINKFVAQRYVPSQVLDLLFYLKHPKTIDSFLGMAAEFLNTNPGFDIRNWKAPAVQNYFPQLTLEFYPQKSQNH